MTDRHTNKAYSLRVPDSIISELRTIAEKESRTLNKQIEYVLAQYLKERNKVDAPHTQPPHSQELYNRKSDSKSLPHTDRKGECSVQFKA